MNRDCGSVGTVGPAFISSESKGAVRAWCRKKKYVFEEIIAKSFCNLVREKKKKNYRFKKLSEP